MQTHGTDRLTGMTKLIVAFRNFGNAPKNLSLYFTKSLSSGWPAVRKSCTPLTQILSNRPNISLARISCRLVILQQWACICNNWISRRINYTKMEKNDACRRHLCYKLKYKIPRLFRRTVRHIRCCNLCHFSTTNAIHAY